MASRMKALVAAHRADLRKLDERTMRRFLRRYNRARLELTDRLNAVDFAKEWTRANILVARDQLEAGIRLMSDELGVVLAESGGRTLRMGTKHMDEKWRMMNRIFAGMVPAPLNVPVLQVLDRLDNLLLMRFDASRLSYGEQLISRMAGELQQSFLQRENPLSTVKRIMKVGGIMDEQQWRAARIVRTELANAHEMASWESGRVAIFNGDLPPDTKKRLVSVFDGRTAPDSYHEHGQVVDWDKPFTRPNGSTFMHSPSRPNDRSVTLAWRPDWKEDALLEDRPEPAE